MAVVYGVRVAPSAGGAFEGAWGHAGTVVHLETTAALLLTGDLILRTF